jgi:hypothetical protein
MSQTGSEMPSRVDQILDLLLDALLERQRARERRGFQPPETLAAPTIPGPEAVEPPTESRPEPPIEEPKVVDKVDAIEDVEKIEPDQIEELAPVPRGQMGRTLFRLAIGLLLFIVLVNVPINRHGVSLARVMPDSAALIIRDGLLVKGEDNDEIYVLQDDKLRWISSLEAFERLHYRWRDVHVVEDSFLDKFEKGRPVHILLKCNGSPHIYRIEREQKRWIKDIPTFEAEGHVWEDVNFVSCQHLRSIPDGPPIPEDAGPPPQP